MPKTGGDGGGVYYLLIQTNDLVNNIPNYLAAQLIKKFSLADIKDYSHKFNRLRACLTIYHTLTQTIVRTRVGYNLFVQTSVSNTSKIQYLITRYWNRKCLLGISSKGMLHIYQISHHKHMILSCLDKVHRPTSTVLLVARTPIL